MEIFKRTTHIDFIGRRKFWVGLSVLLSAATLVLLFARGLNFGLDFTGGTLVELSYAEAADVVRVRQTLAQNGWSDAVVQRFGTARDLMVRVPLRVGEESAATSTKVIESLRADIGEHQVESRPGQAQRCARQDAATVDTCTLQVKRVEFVGPQVGEELAEKGTIALLVSGAAILLYVVFRFEWRFALGAIVATAHDVLLVFGFFSLMQLDFSLSVLAAIMAVLGYSLNDTVVVFDRIRENFRKLRKHSVVEIMNVSLNETLSRTIITSGTTALAMLALFLYGGEIMRGFSIAMLVGIAVGTYSSIFVATPVTLALGITREDMLPPKKEGANATP